MVLGVAYILLGMCESKKTIEVTREEVKQQDEVISLIHPCVLRKAVGVYLVLQEVVVRAIQVSLYLGNATDG